MSTKNESILAARKSLTSLDTFWVAITTKNATEIRSKGTKVTTKHYRCAEQPPQQGARNPHIRTAQAEKLIQTKSICHFPP